MDFVVYKKSQRVYHIKCPMGVFVSLIVGDKKALLFDTEFGIGNLKQTIKTITSLPLIVVNSHGHNDHVGGNYQFDKVYLHHDDFKLYDIEQSEFTKKEIVKYWNKSKNTIDQTKTNNYINNGKGNIIPLTDGDIFDLGNLHLEVIHTPGHTAGSICLYCNEEKMLFVGDAANSFLYLFLDESLNRKIYISSLIKLKKPDFDFMLLSHYDGMVKKEALDAYINCAKNIDIEKSKKYVFPRLSHLQAYIYQYKSTDISKYLVDDKPPEKEVFPYIIYSLTNL